MESRSTRSRRLGLACLASLALLGVPARAQVGGLPSLPGLTKSSVVPKPKDASKPTAAPTKDNPEATVATTSGPIDVERPVDDPAVRATLQDLLPKFPGVRRVEVHVRHGVVTLDGHVEDDDTRGDVTEFTRRVEGVRLVLNTMKTDAQVLSATQRVRNLLAQVWFVVEHRWLLVVLAATVTLAMFGLARLFNAYAETLLAPFIANVLLRSVVGSLIGSMLVVGGMMLGLTVLHLTQAVLSVLGLAGVVGLAVGFAFRDIAENFIASVLLGVRRPFRIGDYVQVAGQAGVVLSLNTRATVLVTLEGNHIRIPNNIIYKEILVNSSAATSTRSNFDVIIPYEVSTASALDAMTGALRDQEGILPEPPARALVEALEPSGVRLRAYFWTPTQGVDGFKLMSDARLKVKVALQQAGVVPPPAHVALSVVGRVPVETFEGEGECRVAPSMPAVTPEQAAVNLKRDAHAADNASALPDDGRPTPIEHALNQGDTRIADEGANLIANGKAEH